MYPEVACDPSCDLLCLRMDGSTSVSLRSRLMDDFNYNPDVFAFLLTTKVWAGV